MWYLISDIRGSALFAFLFGAASCAGDVLNDRMVEGLAREAVKGFRVTVRKELTSGERRRVIEVCDGILAAIVRIGGWSL